MAQIKQFRGLNTVSDALRMGISWLTQADNVNITDTGALEKRAGFTPDQLGSFTSAYSTDDFQRMYLVDGLVLKTYEGTTLATLSSSATVQWTEINDQVYFSNGVDCGIIQPDNSVIDWRWPVPTAPTVSLATGTLASGIYSVCCTYVLADGRETGPSDPVTITLVEGQAITISDVPQFPGTSTRIYIAPANSSVFQLAAKTTGSAITWNFSNDALGIDLTTDGLDPLPTGVSCIQMFRGRVYASQYIPSIGQTVVWYSQPLGFHLFRLNTDFFMVQGAVTMLAPTDTALIVGTTDEVFSYDGERLTQIADYGVIQGQHWAKDEGRTLFWTSRGVCAAMPFTNLTEKSVSVAPGIKAGGTIVRQGGQTRYLVALQQGGSAFNSL